ncbi:serine C-palmitoyltransferase [Entamoeba marina]
MENYTIYHIPYFTWIWQYIGIPLHAMLDYYFLLLLGKLQDVVSCILYYFGMSDYCPAIINANPEQTYINHIYNPVADCFCRPLCGPAEHTITIGLRTKTTKQGLQRLDYNGKDCDAINFGSYNYLGFGGRHPIVTKQVANCLTTHKTSMTGTSSERGVSEQQEQLEHMLAELLHKEEAIVVPMGFATNSTLIPILIGKDDVVFSDALNHSSIITGIKSSEAEVKVFKHNDMTDLKQKLEQLELNGMKNGKQPNKVLIIVEGLYSMEGEYSHSVGALGNTGKGIVEHLGCDFNDVDVLMGTFSKSFASSGGYIASDKQTIELLKSNCYSYVYGTPMLPACAQQIISALEMMKTDEGKQRITQLRKSSITFRRRLKDAGCHALGDDDSPVIPVLIYNSGKMGVISRGCLKRGIAVVAVGFPGCPANACRIRFCISASHTDEDIEKGLEAVIESLTETNTIFHSAPSGDLIHHADKIDIEMLKQLPKNPRKMLPLGESTQGMSICNKPLKPSGIEMSSYDIHNFSNDDERIQQQINTTMTFGCGSCGPRNFYGTTIEHLLLEKKLAEYFGTSEAVLYSYGNNTLTSTVALYAKANDVLLVDEKCNYTIQLGCKLTKAKKIQYKHCDVNDLSIKLKNALNQLKANHKVVIVTEGLFQDDLQIAPLKEICSLRNDNVMVIVDDTLGIGAIGSGLRGSVEHLGMSINEVDVLCGSLETSCCSVGGFCVGEFSILDKHRLFGNGYCFSASAPPFSCKSASYAIEQFMKKGNEMGIVLREKRNVFNQKIKELVKNIQVIGDDTTPYVLLNTNGKNPKLRQYLLENGYYTVLQQHLIGDWCTNDYVRLCINNQLSNDQLFDFVNVLAQF